MDLNSTEKPFVDGYDDLPPPPEELQSGDTQRTLSESRWPRAEVICGAAIGVLLQDGAALVAMRLVL